VQLERPERHTDIPAVFSEVGGTAKTGALGHNPKAAEDFGNISNGRGERAGRQEVSSTSSGQSYLARRQLFARRTACSVCPWTLWRTTTRCSA